MPTTKELGWPGVVSTNWFLLAAPAGLEPAVAARLAEAVHGALAEPAIRERLDASGVVCGRERRGSGPCQASRGAQRPGPSEA